MHIASLARTGVSLKLTKERQGEGGKNGKAREKRKINRGSQRFCARIKNCSGRITTRTQLNKYHYIGKHNNT